MGSKEAGQGEGVVAGFNLKEIEEPGRIVGARV